MLTVKVEAVKEIPLSRYTFAANLISFYYFRASNHKRIFKVKTNNKNSNSNHGRRGKLWRMLLFQIQYYPMVKKILLHLLTFAIRKRFLKVKRGIQVLQYLWERADYLKRLDVSPLTIVTTITTTTTTSNNSNNPPLLLPASSSRHEDKISGNLLCPSPAVIFRGRLLTTPQKLVSLVGGTSFKPLRSEPSMITPIRTSLVAKKIVHERLNSNFGKGVENSLLSFKNQKVTTTTPSVTGSAVTGVATIVLPPPPLPLVKDTKKRPQRIIKSSSLLSPFSSKSTPNVPPPLPPPASSSVIKLVNNRQLSEEAELSRITQQNTKLNSGYKSCEITLSDVIREWNRPASPSNKFSKNSTTKTKWADLRKARHLTQKAWEDIHAEAASPKEKRIKWNHLVEFIDEPDEIKDIQKHSVPTKSALLLRPQPLSEPTGSSLSSSSSSSSSSSHQDNPFTINSNFEKIPITVQRVLYFSEIQSSKPRKTPTKRKKVYK